MHHETDCRKGCGDKDLENGPGQRSPQPVSRASRYQLGIVETEKPEPVQKSEPTEKSLKDQKLTFWDSPYLADVIVAMTIVVVTAVAALIGLLVGLK